jgi:hypothetical protein
MMSNNRGDYASASEWLSVLRKDGLWLSQLQQLQDPSADAGALRAAAIRKIGQGETFEFWDSYQHQVDPVVMEVWEISELTLPKLKIQTIGMLSIEWLEQHACGVREVPEKLNTNEAKEVMADLVDAGLLKENWQPNGLSGTERALVAKTVCEQLEINEVWQVFGQLWGEKPETLRSYLNKALDQKKSLKFQDRLKNILG